MNWTLERAATDDQKKTKQNKTKQKTKKELLSLYICMPGNSLKIKSGFCLRSSSGSGAPLPIKLGICPVRLCSVGHPQIVGQIKGDLRKLKKLTFKRQMQPFKIAIRSLHNEIKKNNAYKPDTHLNLVTLFEVKPNFSTTHIG